MKITAVIRCRLVALAVCVFIVAPIAYMLMDRQRPYDWIAGEVVPPDPKPGEEISIKWTMDVHRYCEGTITRQIVDSHGVIWGYDARPAAAPDQMSRGDILVRTFSLPRQISSGPARYSAHGCYACNPFQRIAWPICVRTPDVKFTIE